MLRRRNRCDLNPRCHIALLRIDARDHEIYDRVGQMGLGFGEPAGLHQRLRELEPVSRIGVIELERPAVLIHGLVAAALGGKVARRRFAILAAQACRAVRFINRL